MGDKSPKAIKRKDKQQQAKQNRLKKKKQEFANSTSALQTVSKKK